MEKVNSYRDLKVWQRARILLKAIYMLTDDFSKSEQYGLTSQLRRASISVPSNIAEGSAKGSTKEFIRFLSIALTYITEKQLEETLLLTSELGRMLNGLQRSLEQKLNSELRTPNSVLANAQTH